MWWIVILAALVWMLFRFAADSNKQQQQIKQQGGMRAKYNRLVSHLLSSDKNCRIINETGTSIMLGVSGISGSTTFNIVQTFGSVTIQYKVDSHVFGKYKLEWVFDENINQDLMVSKITNDIKNHLIQNM